VPRPHQRIRTFAGTLLTLVALLVNLPSSYADTIRSAEWPLDNEHFQADQVWAISRGTGVTVSVIDSGVAANHPDLTGQVLAGTSLLGDGGDGRTDTSGDSHGTAIAGIIAGTGGPAPHTGMFGLAPEAKILPVRVAPDGQVTPSLLAQGIAWAADHGAQVINVSMGSPTPDPLLHQAVNYALSKNIVLVASAGNQGQAGNAPMYPAAFPGVISVSGIDESGAFWAPSESGRGIILAAPATDLYSTNDQDQYVHADGTSYAAAYVSATAALIRSHEPRLSAGQVIRRIISSTAKPHSHPDAKLGYGELNPLAALTSSTAPGSQENPLLKPPAPQQHASGYAIPVAIVVACALLAGIAVLTLKRCWRTDTASGAVKQATAARTLTDSHKSPGPSGRAKNSANSGRRKTKTGKAAR
jgi:type VII secretion-associated serine protease mycosin